MRNLLNKELNSESLEFQCIKPFPCYGSKSVTVPGSEFYMPTTVQADICVRGWSIEKYVATAENITFKSTHQHYLGNCWSFIHSVCKRETKTFSFNRHNMRNHRKDNFAVTPGMQGRPVENYPFMYGGPDYTKFQTKENKIKLYQYSVHVLQRDIIMIRDDSKLLQLEMKMTAVNSHMTCLQNIPYRLRSEYISSALIFCTHIPFNLSEADLRKIETSAYCLVKFKLWLDKRGKISDYANISATEFNDLLRKFYAETPTGIEVTDISLMDLAQLELEESSSKIGIRHNGDDQNIRTGHKNGPDYWSECKTSNWKILENNVIHDIGMNMVKSGNPNVNHSHMFSSVLSIFKTDQQIKDDKEGRLADIYWSSTGGAINSKCMLSIVFLVVNWPVVGVLSMCRSTVIRKGLLRLSSPFNCPDFVSPVGPGEAEGVSKINATQDATMSSLATVQWEARCPDETSMKRITFNKEIERKLEAAEMWLIRRMVRISWTEKRTNDSVLKEANVTRSLIKNDTKRVNRVSCEPLNLLEDNRVTFP
ncbi:hypothetical protein GQR58_028079 [Nymphon striatum]|nr:hypothetical protein GQR58_028079 [Nymphon striatum]